mmetsp:Transcript_27678/g.27541  ORF Transcript_27678/g.27541 Transcript_27678/m.27541 type:complete len:104 (+) Transcript_27678:79-390(+)
MTRTQILHVLAPCFHESPSIVSSTSSEDMMVLQGNNDFYSFDTEKLVWKQIKTCDIPPISRDRHVAVVYNRSIYIFGGYDGFNRVNDFYEYNVDTESWQEVIF